MLSQRKRTVARKQNENCIKKIRVNVLLRSSRQNYTMITSITNDKQLARVSTETCGTQPDWTLSGSTAPPAPLTVGGEPLVVAEAGRQVDQRAQVGVAVLPLQHRLLQVELVLLLRRRRTLPVLPPRLTARTHTANSRVRCGVVCMVGIRKGMHGTRC